VVLAYHGDFDRDAAVASKDCSPHPGTRPVWSEAQREVVCRCLGDTVWDRAENRCVPRETDARRRERLEAQRKHQQWCLEKYQSAWNAVNTGKPALALELYEEGMSRDCPFKPDVAALAREKLRAGRRGSTPGAEPARSTPRPGTPPSPGGARGDPCAVNDDCADSICLMGICE
jgi:hypothetical protein